KLRPVIGYDLSLRTPVVAVKLPLLTKVWAAEKSGERHEAGAGIQVMRFQKPVSVAVVAVHVERWASQMRAIGLIGSTGYRLPVDAIVVAELEIKIRATHAVGAGDAGNLLGGGYGIVVADRFIGRHGADFAVSV